MEIGIIGAGFTGMSAALKLIKSGHKVSIFEASNLPGGLAVGFDNKKWKWPLEAHYHHLFKTDYAIQDLAKEIKHEIIFKRPKTSIFYNGAISQVDSVLSLLTFKEISLISRLRTGFTLFVFKILMIWKPLENFSVFEVIPLTMGRQSWEVIWRPLMVKKFGKYAKKIPASWFWARIKSRTPSLGYPRGGFKTFAMKISEEIRKNGGKIYFSSPVVQIKKIKRGVSLETANRGKYKFDVVISTLPTHLFVMTTKGLPKSYTRNIKKLHGLGAANLILELKKSFLKDGTYWLNINEDEYPFLCVVEHTNFMDRKIYDNKHILYVGNYLETNHRYFKYSDKELINEYINFLKKINPEFQKKWITKSWLFKAPFAQPVISKGYSKTIPPLKTPIKGVYLANIQQVYPWDRGTNYAVELGNKVAAVVLKDLNG